MPTFEFTSPDGKTYEITGPEGATQEQAFELLQGQLRSGGSTQQTQQPKQQEPAGRSYVVRNEFAELPKRLAKTSRSYIPVRSLPEPSGPMSWFRRGIEMLGQPPLMTPEESVEAYGELAKGAGEGVVAGVGGLPGDVESILHYTPFGASWQRRFFPTHQEVGNYLFGEADNPLREFGREATAFGAPNVVGEAASLGVRGGSFAQRMMERAFPMTDAARERNIVEQIRKRASDAADLERKAKAGTREILPGQAPTSYQAFGDEGLGGMEAESRAKFKGATGDDVGETYETRDAAQATAQRTAFNRNAPQSGAAVDLGNHVRSQLAALNAETERAIEAARGEAVTAGAPRPGEGQAASAYGSDLRARAQAAADTSTARHKALYDAIDPDGTAIVDGRVLQQGAADIRRNIRPADELGMSAKERAILELMEKTPNQEPFRNIAALVREINDTMRELAWSGGAKSGSYVRLRAMRDAAERAIGTQIETRIAQSTPDEAARLTDEFAAIFRDEANDSRASFESFGQGNRDEPQTGTAGGRDGSTGAPAGAAAGTPGGELPPAAGNQGVSRNLGREDISPTLFEEIKSRGGIVTRDALGNLYAGGLELEQLFGGRGSGGIILNDMRGRIPRNRVNKAKPPLKPDDMLTALQQERWFEEGADANVMRDRIGQEFGGEPYYNPNKARPQKLDLGAEEAKLDAQREALNARRGALGQQPAGPRLASENMRQYADRIADAEVETLEREGIQSENVRGLDQGARERLGEYRQARTEHGQTFEQGPVGDILARGERRGEYRLAESGAVPGKVFVAGPKGGETIAAYRRAVGDEEALRTLENHAATELRQYAVDADQTINPGKVRTWLNRHEDAMRAFPALRQRFSDAAAATERMGEAVAAQRAAREAFETEAVQKILKAENADDVPLKIGNILASSDRNTQMDQLVALASRDQSGRAMAGLRAGIRDHVIAKFIDNAGDVKDTFQTFMRQNSVALRKAGFTQEQVQAWRDVAQAQRQSAMRGVRPAGGKEANKFRQTVFYLLRRVIGSTAGFLVGANAGGIGEASGLLLGAGGVHAIEMLRAAGLAKQDVLLKNVLMNPKALKALFEKIPPGGKADAALGRLARALVIGGIGGTAAVEAAEDRGSPKSYAQTIMQYAAP